MEISSVIKVVNWEEDVFVKLSITRIQCNVLSEKNKAFVSVVVGQSIVEFGQSNTDEM